MVCFGPNDVLALYLWSITMSLNGTFAIYKGKEYEVSQSRKANTDGLLVLLSRDEADLAYGFERDAIVEDIFKKTVDVDSVEDYFKRKAFGTYKGHEFDVEESNNDKDYYLWACMNPAAIELDFNMIGKYEYEKRVSKDEVNVRFEIERLK